MNADEMTNVHKIPDGSVMVRQATTEEALESGRIALFRAPDGRLFWVGIDGGVVDAPLQVVRDTKAE